MLMPPSAVRVFVASVAVDLRRSFVSNELGPALKWSFSPAPFAS
jgi:hypothetical protein